MGRSFCVSMIGDSFLLRQRAVLHEAEQIAERLLFYKDRAASFLCLLLFFQDISGGGDDEDEVGGDPCAGVAEADGGKRRI